MSTGAERAAAYPNAAVDALGGHIAAGDYYEALGVSPDATGREILTALMGRRRQFPGLDQEWNAVHTALTQQRTRYDAARGIRDELMDEVLRHYGDAVGRRLSRRAIWQQLWRADDDEAPLALRKVQVMRTAEAWQRAENELAQARSALDNELGPGIWMLLDEATNWQQVQRNLPDLPQALETFAQQLPDSGRELAAQLPELQITAEEAAQHRAQRLQVYVQSCPVCHGTRQVQQNLSQVWRDRTSSEPRTMQELSELLERYQRGLGASSDVQVSIPCPHCTRQVIFEVPGDVQKGWVLCGKASDGERRFARLARIEGTLTPSDETIAESSSTRPMSLRDKVICGLVILVYCAGFFGLVAFFVDAAKLQANPTTPMSAAVRLAILAAGAFLLWSWYRHSRTR